MDGKYENILIMPFASLKFNSVEYKELCFCFSLYSIRYNRQISIGHTIL